MSKMDVDGSLPVGFSANPKVCHAIPLTEVDNTVLLTALLLWQDIRNERRFPPRRAITPRLLKPILRNTTLLRVIDGGADYEYRIVGDAYVMAHGQSFQGLRWSQTKSMAPGFHKFIKPVYDRIVESGEPLAMRGWVERGGSSTGLVYCEYIYLPLVDESVDHILIVAVYLRSSAIDHVTTSSFSV